MINLLANAAFKKLGAKWDGKKWVAPALAEKEFNEIRKKYFEDLVIVEVTHDGSVNPERLKGDDWGYQHVRMVAGYIVASASGRDSGAKISSGIAVTEGEFSSGGSAKNYVCTHSDRLVLRMQVARGALELMDRQAAHGRYSYRVIETGESKEELLKELKEIENRLAASYTKKDIESLS